MLELSEGGTKQLQVGAEGSAAGQLSEPRGASVEEAGFVWVADTANNRIDEFSTTGLFVKAVGFGVLDGKAQEETCTLQSACRAGLAGSVEGQLSAPKSIATDSKGHVFVADSSGRVQEFAAESGAFLGQLGPSGLSSVSTAPTGSLWAYNTPTAQLSELQPSLSPTTGAPHAMGESEIGTWAQKKEEAPIEATAVFPPDEPQGFPASDYRRASITYFDAKGRAVDVALPGGGIQTSEYNAQNEVTRTLSADDRAQALAEGCASEAHCKSAEAAQRLSTQSVYSPESEGASELRETTGPEHTIKLESKLGSHEAGEEVKARAHTVYHYDENAPSEGGPYHLATKVTQGALLSSGEEGDVRETVNSYAGLPGQEASLGWRLRAPTQVITDPNGMHLAHTTLYNQSTGQVEETQPPGGASRPHASPTSRSGAGRRPARVSRRAAIDAEGNLWVDELRRQPAREVLIDRQVLGTYGRSRRR